LLWASPASCSYVSHWSQAPTLEPEPDYVEVQSSRIICILENAERNRESWRLHNLVVSKEAEVRQCDMAGSSLEAQAQEFWRPHTSIYAQASFHCYAARTCLQTPQAEQQLWWLSSGSSRLWRFRPSRTVSARNRAILSLFEEEERVHL